MTSWGIDALNGNMIKYYPDSYLIDLDKEAPPAQRNDQTRAERLRFVVINKDQLQKDIARGDGEYLRTYFAIQPGASAAGEKYPAFRIRVSRNAAQLLSFGDPATLYASLEVI